MKEQSSSNRPCILSQYKPPSNYPPPPARRFRSCASQFSLQAIAKLANQYGKAKARIENFKSSSKTAKLEQNSEIVVKFDDGNLDALVREGTELDHELIGLRENNVRELRELESRLAEQKVRVLKSITDITNCSPDPNRDPSAAELEVHNQVVQFAEEAWQKHVDSVVENKLSSAEKKKKEILEQKKVIQVQEAHARLCDSLELQVLSDRSRAHGLDQPFDFTSMNGLFSDDDTTVIVTKPMQRTLRSSLEIQRLPPQPRIEPSVSFKKRQSESSLKSREQLFADLVTSQAEVRRFDEGFVEVQTLVDDLMKTIVELREDNAALTTLAEDIALPVLARNFETLKHVKRGGKDVSLENTRDHTNHGVIENGDSAIGNGHVAAHFAAWSLLESGAIEGHLINEDMFAKTYGITVNEYKALAGVSAKLDELFDMHARLAACGSFTSQTLFRRKDLRFLGCFVDTLNSFYAIDADSMKERGEIFDSMERTNRRWVQKMVYMKDLVELYELTQEAEDKAVKP